MDLTLRHADARGTARFDWLTSKHTFSFGHYHDPAHMGFGPLRVINEDRVSPGQGFPTHPHADMEIVTYVIDGALRHQDSEGNGSVIRPDDVQRMSAGTGIRHSEYNASDIDEAHFLQIWILPERKGLAPGYEQISVAEDEKRGRLRLVGSHDGRDGSVTIHRDVALYASILGPGDRVSHELAPGRGAWIQLIRGSLTVAGEPLFDGDGAAIKEPGTFDIASEDEDSEFLLFDMKM